jgi:N-acetyl-anhydromuramyl-L-alanine amidase AmpD
MQLRKALPTWLLLCASRVGGLADDGAVTASVPLRSWEFIVIHHSATRSGSADIFDAAHRARGMTNGLAYHFVIDNGARGTTDGCIEVGQRWIKQLPGGHCRHERINERAIGICLVGDFSNGQPTAKQLEALVVVVRNLQQAFGIDDDHVVGHGDLAGEATECPGARFSMDSLRTRLHESRTPTSVAAAATDTTP